MQADIVWLEHAGQRLGLLPTLGGGVAAWQTWHADTWHDLWRPWDGATPDRYTLANFAMLPWTNRISRGGFEQAGHFHPVAPNRAGEPYPIHGDGWLQAWQADRPRVSTLRLSLESKHHDGNPYHYRAEQVFTLLEGGLDQSIHITHLGAEPLPYGTGLHPYFPRTPGTRITTSVKGVWLSGSDPLPTGHTEAIPADWDFNRGAPAQGSFVDNCYTGWSGEAHIDWPEHGLRLTMRDLATLRRGRDDGYCLMYRPPAGNAFCFEPVTHPIDAFHLPGRPGLRVLSAGETLSLDVQWRVEKSTR
ncbi:aldose 1-epimerase [Piscinibacter gummiphilus]|uniref:Aldose 1-epimerase n=1 Tax=Piscinibacter gummiphilus TaxID=946333 RepID=A0ABZ0D4T7_9BURK|nr:aldose 1-epimerase [Piscinibacter gummiphilus]WOB10335.1 aldose 1-epimerase [Piscinibacter gummiphilus]